MQTAVETIAELASRAGARVVDIAEPEALALARDTHATIQDYEAAHAFGDELARHERTTDPVLLRR